MGPGVKASQEVRSESCNEKLASPRFSVPAPRLRGRGLKVVGAMLGATVASLEVSYFLGKL